MPFSLNFWTLCTKSLASFGDLFNPCRWRYWTKCIPALLHLAILGLWGTITHSKGDKLGVQAHPTAKSLSWDHCKSWLVIVSASKFPWGRELSVRAQAIVPISFIGHRHQSLVSLNPDNTFLSSQRFSEVPLKPFSLP